MSDLRECLAAVRRKDGDYFCALVEGHGGRHDSNPMHPESVVSINIAERILGREKR